MQKIRATTQIYDDNHLLLQERDLRRIYTAILSQPDSTALESFVYTLQRGEDGGWVIDWEEGVHGIPPDTIPPGGGPDGDPPT